MWQNLELLLFRKHGKREDKATHWEKMFPSPISDKGFIPRIYKEFSELTIKKTHNPHF